MSTTTTPTVKFRGDEHPERLLLPAVALAIDALGFPTRLLLVAAGDPKAVEQAERAVSLAKDSREERKPLPAEASAALIAALIVAEHVLNDHYPASDAHKAVQRALRATGRRLIERGGERGWVPYDIFFVMYDETEDYELANFKTGDAAKYIAAIEAVYMVEMSTHVHLCEITPSIALHYFESRAIRKDEYEDDEQAERVRDDVEQEIATSYEDVSYLHVSDVERYIEANKRGTVYHWGNPGLDLDELREEALDKLARDIRETRKRNGHPEITDMPAWIAEHWKDEDIDRLVDDLVIEKVREAVTGNPVL